MYSFYNEGKSVVAERFIRTLKNKLYLNSKIYLLKDILLIGAEKYLLLIK